jgi:hypothetical protein
MSQWAVCLVQFVVVTVRDLVEHVLRLGAPTQVGRTIVQTISVEMTNLVPRWTTAMERFTDQLVDATSRRIMAVPGIEDLVALLGYFCLANALGSLDKAIIAGEVARETRDG